MTDESKMLFNDKDLLALLSDPSGRQVFLNAVADTVHTDILGRHFDSYNVDRIQFLAAAISSSQYAIQNMSQAARSQDALDLLRFAVQRMSLPGLILEFGVFSGRTINHIAQLAPKRKIHGFDSFEGLPETWRPGFAKGAFAMPSLPPVHENVELVVGWFDRTLPVFLDAYKEENVALLHVDCDIYSSTQVIFQQLKNRIVPGTIIVFDEYYNYPGWEMNEFRAFKEFVERNRVHYDYIGLVPGHQQVAVRVVG